MINKDFDPYDALVELQDVALAMDEHIKNLINNQKQIVTAINELSDRVKQLEKMDAITGEK